MVAARRERWWVFQQAAVARQDAVAACWKHPGRADPVVARSAGAAELPMAQHPVLAAALEAAAAKVAEVAAPDVAVVEAAGVAAPDAAAAEETAEAASDVAVAEAVGLAAPGVAVAR